MSTPAEKTYPALLASVTDLIALLDEHISLHCDCGSESCGSLYVTTAIKQLCETHGIPLPADLIAPQPFPTTAAFSLMPEQKWHVLAADPSQAYNIIAALGPLPQWISPSDNRCPTEQLNEHYPFGGWQPIKGFTLNTANGDLSFPGDPDLRPFAYTIHDATCSAVLVYQSDFVAVLRGDGTYEVARLD